MGHSNSEVRKAIIRLDDALCTWERATSIESVFILRETGGFVHRAVSGKPNVPLDITDATLVKNILHESNGITVTLEDAREFVEWAKDKAFCNSGQHICDRLANQFELTL